MKKNHHGLFDNYGPLCNSLPYVLLRRMVRLKLPAYRPDFGAGSWQHTQQHMHQEVTSLEAASEPLQDAPIINVAVQALSQAVCFLGSCCIFFLLQQELLLTVVLCQKDSSGMFGAFHCLLPFDTNHLQ